MLLCPITLLGAYCSKDPIPLHFKTQVWFAAYTFPVIFNTLLYVSMGMAYFFAGHKKTGMVFALVVPPVYALVWRGWLYLRQRFLHRCIRWSKGHVTRAKSNDVYLYMSSYSSLVMAILIIAITVFFRLALWANQTGVWPASVASVLACDYIEVFFKVAVLLSVLLVYISYIAYQKYRIVTKVIDVHQGKFLLYYFIFPLTLVGVTVGLWVYLFMLLWQWYGIVWPCLFQIIRGYFLKKIFHCLSGRAQRSSFSCQRGLPFLLDKKSKQKNQAL